MNLAKFNEELAIKKASALKFERNQDLNAAVNKWIEISELTLKVSRTPGIEIFFRNMLIKRTEEIIKHVKELKSRVTNQKLIDLPAVPINNINEVRDIPSKAPKPIQQDTSSVVMNNETIINGPESENLPNGLKEINASKNFKILTPHDPNYVDKHIKQDINLDIFKHDKKIDNQENLETKTVNNNVNQGSIELDEKDREGNIICFACGHPNTEKSKICASCGTQLT